jgi:hypothetical protein
MITPHEIIEVGGITFQMMQKLECHETVYGSIGTVNLPFEQTKHLLSSRPLRRPNRTHPGAPVSLREPVDVSAWLEKLKALRELGADWNHRGAEPPTEWAITAAESFLVAMGKQGIVPTRVAASAIGGVGITRRVGDRMAYVEFYNNGTACALFSLDEGDGETFKLGVDSVSFARILEQMDAYLHG